jgi:hypothetical protein
MATTIAAERAHACDVCAVYTATEQRESRAGFRLGVAEQFSRFTTLQEDGHKIDNPGEHLNSSITQLIAGYDFTSRFGVQLTLPVITRVFRRREAGVITSGSETGIGDMSLLGLARPFNYVTDKGVVLTSLLGGLKFPTGSSHRLREELRETEDGPLGVHGHDLALGSGSVDGIIGGAFFTSWQRFFWTTAMQYAMRTTGSIDYRYANELTWSGGPGAYPLLTHDRSVSIQALVTGEHKGTDTLDGEEAEDTGITSVFMGPSIAVTWGTTLAADLGVDFPILQDNTSVQLVRDYRVHGGLSYRF